MQFGSIYHQTCWDSDSDCRRRKQRLLGFLGPDLNKHHILTFRHRRGVHDNASGCDVNARVDPLYSLWQTARRAPICIPSSERHEGVEVHDIKTPNLMIEVKPSMTLPSSGLGPLTISQATDVTNRAKSTNRHADSRCIPGATPRIPAMRVPAPPLRPLNSLYKRLAGSWQSRTVIASGCSAVDLKDCRQGVDRMTFRGAQITRPPRACGRRLVSSQSGYGFAGAFRDPATRARRCAV